jgi:hypothetical protein
MPGEDKDRQTEARRILEQVAREAEIDGMGRQARHEVSADADKEDWAEYWGARIVRWLGVLLLIGRPCASPHGAPARLHAYGKRACPSPQVHHR